MLECLHLRPQYLAFEAALRAQALELARLDDERFARIRGFEKEGGALAVVSEMVTGHRLIDILETRQADDAGVSGIDAAFGFLLQAMPALAELHACSIIHGAVAPGRIIVTPNSQVVLLDSIYGAAIERLNLSRRALWTSFGILTPPMAGAAPINPCTDVAQVALCALLLGVGRPLDARAGIAGLAPLVDELAEVAEIRAGTAFAEGVARFFSTSLPAEGRRATVGSEEAAAEIRRLVGHISEEESLNALAELVCFQPQAKDTTPPKDAAPLSVRVTDPDPEPVPAAPVPAVADDPGWVEAVLPPAPVPMPAEVPRVEAPVFSQPAVRVPMPAEVPKVEAPVLSHPPVLAEPIPVAPPAPAVHAFTPPAETVAPVEAFLPAAVPAPPVTLPAVAQAPSATVPEPPAMLPPPAQPPVRQPVFAEPPSLVQSPPLVIPPVTSGAPLAPTVAAPALRIKQEAPKGYAPPRHRDPDGSTGPLPVKALPFAARGKPENQRRSVPWKAVAAAAIVVSVGAFAGRAYLMGGLAPAGDVRTVRAAAAPPLAPVTGSLAIDSQPSGATVALDGKEVGLTPLILSAVPAGRHQVAVRSGTATVQQTVRVDAGKQATISVPVFSGWVAVFAPIRLDVSEGTRALGTSETGRILLSPGRHVLTLSNRDFGFRASETVDIRPGEERVLNVRPMGLVNLNASPWAEVWVDGTRAGETPLANLEVPLGTREFVFKHPQYGERRLTATITTSASALSVDFSRPPSYP